MTNTEKRLQEKVTRNLLDTIVLQLLNDKQMHGYEMITKIKKTYGINFGPSTIYPILSKLEQQKLIRGAWNTDSKRPIKNYVITSDGKSFLCSQTRFLTQLCSKFERVTSYEPLKMDLLEA